MFKATEAIYNALKASKYDFKVFTEETENLSIVWLQFAAKSGSNYRIRFISADDDNDVAVRVMALIRLEENKIPSILPVINNLNKTYRYVKFVIEDDGGINVLYDFPVSASNVEECAEEIVIRFVKIIDSAYSVLMRAIWA